MCDSAISLEQVELLQQIERLLLSVAYLPYIDETYLISATQPYVVDYKDRRHVFIWTPTSQAVSLEDFGNGTLAAQVWTNLGLPQGLKIYATGVTNGTVPIMIRCTNEVIP